MTSRRQAERAVETHADVLSALPNVVGIGIRESVAEGPSAERTHGVAVYVTQKKPASELDPSELIPGFVDVDDRGDSVKVRVEVIEMGEVGPEGGAPGDTDIPSIEGDNGSTFFAQ